MIKQEIMLGNKAKVILQAIAAGQAPIIKTYTDIDRLPNDDCTGWLLEIRTVGGDHLTLYMEGLNIAAIHAVVDHNGDTLVDPKRPLAVLDWLSGDESAALEQAVMTAVAQSVPR